MSSIKGLKNTGFLATTAAVAVLAIGAFNTADAQQRGGYQGQGAQGQAQGQSGQTPQPQFQRQQGKAVDVSDKKLEQFVSVQKKLKKLKQQQQQGGGNPKQARKEMMQAIQDSGLSMQEYSKINRAVRSNPDLRKKYQKMAQ
jgi:V8-like Glu-specific endopeptidase